MKLSFILFLTGITCDLVFTNRYFNNIVAASRNPGYSFNAKNINDQLIQHFILHKNNNTLRRYLNFLAAKRGIGNFTK